MKKTSSRAISAAARARVTRARGAAASVAVAGAALALFPAASIADVNQEVLLLDTYEDSSDGSSGPVSTSDNLTPGATYTVTVTGTFSIWKASEYNNPFIVCGSPEPAPQTPSPGRTNGKVSHDAEVNFAVAARRKPFNCGSLTLPQHHDNFRIEMSNGGGFSHIEPNGGPYNSPQPAHRYIYDLQGQGAPASFRMGDSNLRDNYGQLTIDVRKANNPPNCSNVVASDPTLWPPNHKFRTITLSGGTDPDGDPVALKVLGVTQDEPLNGLGDGDTAPDAESGTTADSVRLRAERSGLGDGRVYRIAFEGSDPFGAKCQGTALVGVPHDQGQGSTPVDSGLIVNSFGP